MQESGIIAKNNEDEHAKDTKCFKVRDHCYHAREYRDAARRIFNLKYGGPKEISIFFHNGSNYDYHFIIK